MIQIDNIEIDPTALVVLGGFALGMIIAPFDSALIKREYRLEWLYHTAKFMLMFLLGGALLHHVLPKDGYFVPRLIACSLSYSISFDLFLNFLRGKEIFYIGQTAFLDKMARKYLKTGLNYIFVRLLAVFLIGVGIVIHILLNN